MKKMEYLAPEMEVLEIKYSKMLCSSGDGNEPDYGGSGDPDDPEDNPD